MKRSRLVPYLIAPLLVAGFVAFGRFALVEKGVPTASYAPFVFMAIGLSCAALLILQALRGGDSKVFRDASRIGRFCIGLALAVFSLSVGVTSLDNSLFSDIQEYPDRYTLDGKTRNVRVARIPSETTLRLEIPDEGELHTGFGVAKETFASIPHTLSYTITVSSPGGTPQTVIHKWIKPGSSDNWMDASLNLSSFEGSQVEITMSVEYDEPFASPEWLSLCRYYAKLIFVPDFRFDISQRAAVWIEPKIAAARTPEENNIILIGIDALRADHMSAYGYERETTPYIDAFAESGALFTNCYTAAPWTLPSFFSMLTSTYPSVHQYGTNFHGEIREKTAAIWKIGAISPDYNIKTLAEILRERGYYTAAFVNNPFLSTQNEVDRGFDEFNSYRPTSVEGVDLVLPWLDRHRNDKFFLFFHVMDPHDFSLKGSPIYELPPRFGDADGDLLATETNKYDTGVSFCDEQMGKLLAGMKRLGLGQHTLVIITSDHGEELHDRGGTGHGHSLNEELLRVPLILRPPGGVEARKVFDDRVSSLDIAPTILDALDVATPSYYQGESLAPILDGGSLPSRPIFAEALGSGHEKKAIVADDHKLIYTATSNEFELYNLKDDPGEKRNLALRAPEVESKLKAALQEFVTTSHEGFHVVLNPPAGLEMCEGTLTTEGAFMRVMPLDLAKAGIFKVDDDARRIHFRLRSEHGVSGLVFKVYPPDAPVKLELTRRGDAAPTQIRLGAAEGKPLTAPVELDREMLRALGTSDVTDIEDEGLYVWLKESTRKSKPVEIDTATKEKLEALGYLGNR